MLHMMSLNLIDGCNAMPNETNDVLCKYKFWNIRQTFFTYKYKKETHYTYFPHVFKLFF